MKLKNYNQRVREIPIEIRNSVKEYFYMKDEKLKILSEKIDKALELETEESLTSWLMKQRNKENHFIKIIQGDCIEKMQQIPDGSVDMVFADLPYGTTNCAWDIKIPFEPLWKQWNRITKENAAIILTGQQPFTTDIINSNRKHFRYEIIWEKTQKMGFLDANRKPLRAHENIIVFYRKLPTYNPQKVATVNTTVDNKGTNVVLGEHYGKYNKNKTWKEDGTRYPHSVIKISNWNGALFGNTDKAVKHPTQKPVELLDWLIKTYTNEGDTVLDCCMGSGTTGVSCKKNNRKFIGIEKCEIFFFDAMERLLLNDIS